MKLITILLTLISFNTQSAECLKEGLDIIKEQEKRMFANYEFEKQEIHLLDLKSQTKTKRTMNRHSKNENKLEKSLITFIEPFDIKGTALLTWEQDQREDDQWLYTPALKKMQRIAGSGKKKYFMGTDFTYADLENESISDYNYTCEKQSKCSKKSNKECYTITAIPKNKAVIKQTGYKKRVLTITTKNLLTRKIKYYDRKGKFLKSLRNKKWKKIESLWRPYEMLMKRPKYHQTTIKIVDRTINKVIPSKNFTERFIKTGEYLR